MALTEKRVKSGIFGLPTLASANNGKARWIRGSTSPLDQKSPTGWLAELYGGVQSGDDWARVNIPVDELEVVGLHDAMWTYYMTNDETMGVNLVIWVHDPENNDNRAEITQRGNVAGLIKTSGWNVHKLVLSTDQFFFYGEGTTGTDLTAGTLYGWDDFQADRLFKKWTIYRITIEYGWEASGTFESAYVADINLNHETIYLQPVSVPHMKTVIVKKTMLATAKTTDEVISEATSGGTDWDFDFGGTGYITKGVITHNAAITPRLSLLLFTNPPIGEMDDAAANTSPISADVPYYLGRIDFPAMMYNGSGDASAIATPSTYGNLPLAFDAPVIYGILVQQDATSTFVAEALTIALTADMEDN